MAELKKETRELGEFHSVKVKGIGKIELKQGSTQEVTIEADEHILSRMKTDVINGCLIIDIGRDWLEKLSAGLDFLSTHGINFYITMKQLDALDITGSCKIGAVGFKGKELHLNLSGASSVEFEDIQFDVIQSNLPGAGKLSLQGKTKEQSVSLTGVGSYMAEDLESEKTRISLTGVGSAKLWVTKELDATITGVGSIEYYGEPEVKQSVAMMGSIKNLGKK
ncbi:MAG: head GIN domain-containing protein [Anaerolineaceae bacterium]